MRYVLSLVFLFCATPAFAHLPEVVSGGGPIKISDPNTSFAYYGELSGESQTFYLESDEEFTLYISVLEPDLSAAARNHGATVYFEGVAEPLVELEPAQANWESFFEFFGGDYYLKGPEYREEEAQAGRYEIVVFSPDNTGKYVLVTGTVEDFSNTSFAATLKEIYKVKLFFEKSPIAILETPFVYGPLGLLLFVMFVGWFAWSRVKKKRSGAQLVGVK